MLKQSDIAKSIDAYKSVIDAAVKSASKVTLPEPIYRQFRTDQLSHESIDKLCADVPAGGKGENRAEFLYVFCIADSCEVSCLSIIEEFSSARDFQSTDEYEGKKNLCRPNNPADSNKCLYVGRSYTPKSRLKQHLTASTSGTYAIHFEFWAQQIELTVDFYLYEFIGLGDIPAQVLEDGIWDLYKPLLGKRGGR